MANEELCSCGSGKSASACCGTKDKACACGSGKPASECCGAK